jgi:hypothetical protein
LAAGFDPGDFLELAKRLVAGNSPTQAELRTAVSRAYYAAHLTVREKLTSDGTFQTTGTGDDHEMVITYLRQKDDVLGDHLDSLRRRRNQADYRLEPDLDPNETRFAIALAETVLRSSD